MNIIKKNWKLKLISLIIAILMWSYIISNTNPTVKVRLNDIQIVYQNQDSLLKSDLILDSKVKKTVDISVSGQRNRILNLTNQHIKVTANLENLQEGIHNLKLNYTLPDGITLLDYPNTLDINIEKIISKNFKVDVINSGKIPQSIILESKKASPSNVTVKGPRSIIDRITKLITELSLEDLKENSVVNKEVKALDNKGQVVDGVTYGQNFVNINALVYTQKEVPIKTVLVGELPNEYKLVSSVLNRSSVFIKGPESVVNKVKSIKTNEINISNINKSKKVEVHLSLPSDVFLVDDDAKYTVDFEVKSKINKVLEIPIKNIKVKNLDESIYSYQINSKNIKVILHGFVEDLEKININNTTLNLDLSEVELGSYTINPEVIVNEKVIDSNILDSVDNVDLDIISK